MIYHHIKSIFEDIWYKIWKKGIRKLLSNKHGRLITSKAYWTMLHDRHKYGFDESETWSLDYSLTKLIAPRFRMFNRYARDCGSLPSWILSEERDKSLAKGYKWNSRWARIDNKAEDRRCWKRAKKRWCEILDKVQATFDDMELEGNDWDAWQKKWKPTADKINKKIDKAKTHEEKKKIWESTGTWRKYRPGAVIDADDLVWASRKEGLRLFADQYESFWW